MPECIANACDHCADCNPGHIRLEKGNHCKDQQDKHKAWWVNKRAGDKLQGYDQNHTYRVGINE